ncbi:MAG: type transport system ATP-binding protein [Bacteroidota bacterium]|nr:type transport system ATP-binding protein [Bacteroidota bacterium]
MKNKSNLARVSDISAAPTVSRKTKNIKTIREQVFTRDTVSPKNNVAVTKQASVPGASAAEIRNLSKSFYLSKLRYSTLREEFINIFKSGKKEQFRALSNLTFDIGKGEFFGIIGRNGSGKSTLLKMLSKVYAPDSGSVTVNGAISPFLELGVGMNSDLTARENIFTSGLVLGLTLSEIRNRFDDIVKFAELEDFIDVQVKYFSSGMYVRLAFSIAVQAHNHDILLIDEVLAVGDENFKKKCKEKFAELRENREKTIVFVSHDMYAIKDNCDRVMVLEEGKILFIGTPAEAVEIYLNLMSKHKELDFDKR